MRIASKPLARWTRHSTPIRAEVEFDIAGFGFRRCRDRDRASRGAGSGTAAAADVLVWMEAMWRGAARTSAMSNICARKPHLPIMGSPWG